MQTNSQVCFGLFIKKQVNQLLQLAPGASTASSEIAEGLFNQVKELSHEQQLQIQRDLINKVDTQISRQYGSLGDTTKVLFWYLLAQGMDNGTVIPVPGDYQLSSGSQALFSRIQALPFEQQITLSVTTLHQCISRGKSRCRNLTSKDAMNRVSTSGAFVAFFFQLV